jgi:SAM-dependent methyltransferase
MTKQQFNPAATKSTHVDWNAYGDERLLSRNRLLLEHHRPVQRRFIDFFAKVDTRQSVLDVGCSDGFWMGQLRDLGFNNLTGIDLSGASLARAKQKNLNVHCADAERLTFQHEFDIVIVCDVLEHIPHPDKVLHGIRRALIPSGLLYATIPVCDSLRDRWQRTFRRQTRIQQLQEWDPTHVNAWNASKLSALLEHYGFSVTDLQHDYNPFPMVGLLGTRLYNACAHITAGGRFGRTLSVQATPR